MVLARHFAAPSAARLQAALVAPLLFVYPDLLPLAVTALTRGLGEPFPRGDCGPNVLRAS